MVIICFFNSLSYHSFISFNLLNDPGSASLFPYSSVNAERGLLLSCHSSYAIPVAPRPTKSPAIEPPTPPARPPRKPPIIVPTPGNMPVPIVAPSAAPPEPPA